MIRSMAVSIFAVFLFMGINVSHINTEHSVMAGAASLFIPVANAEKEDTETSTKSAAAAGSPICTAISDVQHTYDLSQVVEKEKAHNEDVATEVEKEKADSEKEAKDAKDAAEIENVQLEHDGSASQSDKNNAENKVNEKDHEYESAKTAYESAKTAHDHAKTAHDHAKTDVSKAKTKLKDANASSAPCTTAGGKSGYWNNSGTPAAPSITAPKSMREVFGK